METNVESTRKPILSAKQVGLAAAFGGCGLAIILAGFTIPIPGTVMVSDPREIFTTIGASLTGPIGGMVVGFLSSVADPTIQIASIIAHILGGIYNGFVYKNASWRFKDNKLVSLALWAAQVMVYYVVVMVPLLVAGLLLFFPDPEYTGYFAMVGAIEVGALPEAVFTTIVTTVIMAALPEKYRRPLW